MPHYKKSMFHQILGVAFFHFFRSQFKNINNIFLRSYFLWKRYCLFSKLDHFTSNTILASINETCHFDILSLAKCSYQITSNFQGCWGKMIKGKFHTKVSNNSR